MGRYIKNRELKSGAYNIRLPHAPGSVGPDGPVDGLIKYNETIHKAQYFSEGQWHTIGYEGKVEVFKDEFMGDGETREFSPLTITYEQSGDELYILVFIGNVFQNPGVAYILQGNKITFTSPPGNMQPIVIIHGLASTKTI